MPDSRVTINAAGGTVPVDGFTQSDGDIRQAVVIGDATNAQTATVDAQGRLLAAISGASVTAPAAANITASGSTYVVNVQNAGNITIWLSGSITSTGAAVTTGGVAFEQSADGITWAPLAMQRQDGVVLASFSNNTIASGAAFAFNAALLGSTQVRVRTSSNASSGTLYVQGVAGGSPFSPVVSIGNTVAVTGPTVTKGTQASQGFTVQPLRDAGRTNVTLLVDAAAASAANAETLASYGGSNGATSLTGGTAAFTVPSGKTYRITSLSVTATGSAAGSIRVRLRSTSSTTGPLLANLHMIVPAASGGDTETASYPDGIEVAAGSVIGMTFFASATTVTYSVTVTGFHY